MYQPVKEVSTWKIVLGVAGGIVLAVCALGGGCSLLAAKGMVDAEHEREAQRAAEPSTFGARP
jgi:hypothetical protein